MKKNQLISAGDISKEEIDQLIGLADRMRNSPADYSNTLSGKVVASLFFEPSTRTRLSFEAAANRLGARVISVSDVKTTSASKGESLADTIRVVEKFSDAIVMRHPESGSAKAASGYTEKPFINAGDGSNQHPSQALLDIYTIKRELGRIEGLTIAYAGDLKFGRTVHSQLQLIRHYNINKVIFISPPELKLPDEYCRILKESGIAYEETEDLKKSVNEADILYMTRIQHERIESEEEFLKYKGIYRLTADIVIKGKQEMRVLHPLPRVDEIASDVDGLKQAAYFRQAENGMWMRMALLNYLILNFKF